MPAILAVDPGLTGAIVVLDPTRYLIVHDMPTRTVRKATRIDLRAFADIVREERRARGATTAIIEHVGAMPGQGVSSAFNFGFTTGAIHGVLSALGCNVHTVTPAAWKFGVGLKADPNADKRARKAASRARAIELFPNDAQLFARAKDDGRAEAALIAWWFARKDGVT